jgi:NADH-quinone oxidoreductase subunit H
MGRMMNRKGATYVDVHWPVIGKIGIFQLVCDLVKMLGKEDIVPEDSERFAFHFSFFLIVATAIGSIAILPLAGEWLYTTPGAGILYIFGIMSLYPVAVLIGGWASNNKYSIIGGFRSAAQLISYEIPLMLSVVGVVMLSGELSLKGIVEKQTVWYLVIMPIGVITYIVSMAAETERIPFDLPEAEAELVMGWRTEFAGIRYMMAMFHEYIGLLVSAFLFTIFFLGGWQGPFVDEGLDLGFISVGGDIIAITYMLIKVHLVVVLMIWVRGALPRVRIDQLLDIGWKRLIPLALLNIIWVTALILLADPNIGNIEQLAEIIG